MSVEYGPTTEAAKAQEECVRLRGELELCDEARRAERAGRKEERSRADKATAQLERLREDVGLVATWCESEALEAAGDIEHRRRSGLSEHGWWQARIQALYRVEGRLLEALQQDTPEEGK